MKRNRRRRGIYLDGIVLVFYTRYDKGIGVGFSNQVSELARFRLFVGYTEMRNIGWMGRGYDGPGVLSFSLILSSELYFLVFIFPLFLCFIFRRL